VFGLVGIVLAFTSVVAYALARGSEQASEQVAEAA
jgi:hypothetical protein